MSRYNELEKLKKLLSQGEKPQSKKEPKVEINMDLNDDGEVDESDVEMVEKEVRKKKIIKKDK